MSDTHQTVDRAAVVRRMVEDEWRAQVLFARHLGETHPTTPMEQFTDVILDFTRRSEERYQATAALMPPEQAELFFASG